MKFNGFFKGLARLTRTFRIEAGGFRAEGVPAVLLGIGGVVIAAGVTTALARGADRLPETLREVRGLAQALRRDDVPRLHA